MILSFENTEKRNLVENIPLSLSYEISKKNVDDYFKEKVLETVIRENISLAEAPSKSMTIFDYKPASNGAEDYLKLTKEILEREEIK